MQMLGELVEERQHVESAAQRVEKRVLKLLRKARMTG
jgi:hypothetical protein